MAGQVRALLNRIIEFRTRGNPFLVPFVRARIMLKGICPENYDETSEDDPVMISRVKMLAVDMGIDLDLSSGGKTP